jgi:hypothetical protein
MTIATTNPFDLSKNDFVDQDELRLRLQAFIKDLLENDFERLCALMYRHDVKEQAFNDALLLPTDDERSLVIAKLVIERELQKMETRAAYARSRNNNKLEE